MKKIKNITISIATAVALIINPMTAHAIYIPEDMNDQLVMATQLLEEVLKDDYDSELEELKQKVYEEDCDLTLSMEALGENGNIFAEADYIELVAAYITVTDNSLSICDIDFFDTSYEKQSITEKKAYKYYNYEKQGDGTYKKGTAEYLTEDGYIDVYEKNDNGTYSYTGQEYIELDEIQVYYLAPQIKLLSADELLARYEADDEDNEGEYKSRLEMLKASGVSARGLRESIMLKLYAEIVLSDDEQQALALALSTADENRLAIIKTASTLIGKVPYQWGGKSYKQGYDDEWWTFDDNGEQKGLDCSGYVQWVYRTAGYTNYAQIGSTSAILNNCETITESELQPGDIGVLNNGETVNHTGIYLGNGYWIHSSSSKNTVTISQFPFTIYKRVSGFDEQTFIAYEYIEDTYDRYTLEDIYLISQLVSHEAAGEGLNGWIGVTEVVMNRLKSDKYPNNVHDVIYDEGQFAYVEEIEAIEPSENIIAAVQATLSGRVRILNNPNVLYFRNPGDAGDEDWGSLKAYTRINNHVFYY